MTLATMLRFKFCAKYVWSLVTLIFLTCIIWKKKITTISTIEITKYECPEPVQSPVIIDDTSKYQLSYDEIINNPYLMLPLQLNIRKLVDDHKSGITPNVKRLYDYNYDYIIRCDHICKENIEILFLVKSAAGNFERRRLVRETWGKPSPDHRIVFVIGSSYEHNKEILKESEIHNDILQYDYEDTYHKLAYKDMMAFKWIIQTCSHYRNISVVDDDIVVNVANCVKFYNQSKQARAGGLYGGYLWADAIPKRENHKNIISMEEYPFHYYPPYVAGACSFFTYDVIEDMYYASLYTSHLTIDDSYLGVLAKKLKVKPFDLRRRVFVYDDDLFKLTFSPLCKLRPDDL